MIVTLIDSYVTGREEFQLTYGYQADDVMLYLLEGEFSCTVDGTEFRVRQGDLVFFDPCTLMSRHVISTIKFLYVKFHIKREELFYARTGVCYVVTDRMKADLQRIEQLCVMNTQMGLKMREHYLNDLLLCLAEQPSKGENAEEVVPHEAQMAPVTYMKSHLDKELTLGKLARVCGVSVSALESKFRAIYGVSVYRYLINLRMEEARRLLSKTSYTVTEIAARCGYDNLFYFCNVFKKHSGMTPTEYRRQHLV